MSPAAKCILLLVVSNFFMLTAWYLHLKVEWLDGKAMYVAAILSWGIAFFEYQFHIPANRIGAGAFSLAQLQIIQIGMSLIMFIPFSIIIMDKKMDWDYLIAAFFLIIGAYFIFRDK